MTTPANENRLISFLRDRIVGQASGRLIMDPSTRQPGDSLVGSRPKDKFFVGQLRGKPDDKEDISAVEFRSKVTPNCMTLRFMTEKAAKSSLEIEVDTLLFYRVLPTYEQQGGAYRRVLIPVEDEDDEAVETDDATAREDEPAKEGAAADSTSGSTPKRKREGERLAQTYRRVALRVTLPPIQLVAGEVEEKSLRAANAALTAAVEALKAKALADARICTEAHVAVRLGAKELESKAAFERTLKVKGEPPKLGWDVRLSVEKIHIGGDACYNVTLSNEAEDDKHADVSENSMFSPQVTVKLAGTKLRPFHFHVIPDDFRHDRSVWVHAINCSSEASADRQKIWSTHSPAFEQLRYMPSSKYLKVAPKFATLATDPMPVLTELAETMEQFDRDAWQPVSAAHPIGSVHHAAVEEARSRFRNEIHRVKDGIECLRADQGLLRAFKLMNESMKEMAGNAYDSWRTFQIAFITAMARDVASSHNPKFSQDAIDTKKRTDDFVDIIYFPTGGGKTECYLGLVIFQAFYDRISGKTSGVTAWARFPLRLLGLQQFQRIFKTMHFAEMVRRRNRIEGDQFSVGLLVGKEATPNAIDNDTIEALAAEPYAREKCRVVYKCPACEGATAIRYVPATARIEHFCQNFASKKCSVNTMPVYVSDEEVFRHAPTVVVGTIDKLALAAMQANISLILGHATHRCPTHGFCHKAKCTHKQCSLKPEPIRPEHQPRPPRLLIQDELHLLRESLGTFDSHYEGMLQELVARAPNPGSLKVVAATATIERFETQCRHLYQKEARRFPEEGPRLGESFYAETKPEVRRQFLGLMPYGVTHINAMMDVLYFFHRDIQLLSNGKPGDELWKEAGLNEISEKEARKLLLDTEPSLSYFTSKADADKVSTSIDVQVNEYLRDENLKPLPQQTMTAETVFEEVNRALENLERPPPQFEDRIHAITATSMVSHGVDVARLNFMVFFGMPNMNAEYVQSSSRVGRSNTGLVLCMYRPGRERDRSRYHLHGKYHEFIDRLIEPVAINRWSRFSIERTIAGLVSAFLINHIQPLHGTKSLLMVRNAKAAIEAGHATVADCTEFLMQAYGDDDEVFTTEIRRLVNEIFDRILNAPKQMLDPMRKLDDLLSRPQSGETRLVVMESLRDTDTTVPFSILPNARELLRGEKP